MSTRKYLRCNSLTPFSSRRSTSIALNLHQLEVKNGKRAPQNHLRRFVNSNKLTRFSNISVPKQIVDHNISPQAKSPENWICVDTPPLVTTTMEDYLKVCTISRLKIASNNSWIFLQFLNWCPSRRAHHFFSVTQHSTTIAHWIRPLFCITSPQRKWERSRRALFNRIESNTKHNSAAFFTVPNNILLDICTDYYHVLWWWIVALRIAT